GDFDFSTEVLLEKVGRVACAESADFDNDGDIDLAVCVFGNTTGKIIWMEQKENFRFEEHILDARPGAIHAFPFDADGDSDIDLVVSLSQDYEEVLLFRNNGKGDFSKEILFNSDKIYFAMTGIELSDLDRDGDIDILVTNGDALNYYEIPDGVDPNNVHGLSWLENNGLGKFQYRDIIRIWGAYSVKPLDVDGDGDTDLVLSTMQLPEVFPRARLQGMIWLENDGEQDFFRHDIDLNVPSLTASIEIFDLDSDGSFEILGGTMDQSGGDAGHRLFSFNPLRSNN
ncbi:MAG: VCBS repeat-containing protein, partial [SAR202 cluster bacterium]|nr:VCBS repeat-containing protein [SAR202 cluster bacterium]